MSTPKKERRFLLQAPVRDMEQFEALAAEAAKLKPHGRVCLAVGTLAEKARYEIPEGGSAWHEYTVFNPTLHKIVPHPKIAPFVPADYVKKNRDLMTAKEAVLRKHDLGAWMLGQEPYFMSEAFFEAYPHLRGPRIEHPRRSRGEEFAMCTDLEEVREIYAWMLAELKRTVPQLEMFMFNTNDAGSGFCWAEWLYSGPNGPKACMRVTAGERIPAFLRTLHEGARAGGGDISVFIGHVNFRPEERADVLAHLPPDSGVRDSDNATMGVGTLLAPNNPARGLVNPFAVIGGVERIIEGDIRNVLVGLGALYHRTTESIETIGKVVDIVADGLDRPVKGLRARLGRLHEYAERWAGKKNAESVTEALFDLDQLLKAKRLICPRYSLLYCAVSMRHLTRPLLWDTRVLSPEEEAYFLPHVFNNRESEARHDYIDLHGGRMKITAPDAQGLPGFAQLLAGLGGVADVLEAAKDGPEGKWLFDLGTSVRVYAAALRSIDNFYFGQLARDRSAAAFEREQPYVPEKVGNWDGEGDILAWNERMRDEFDNATELIALLEERGIEQVAHTESARDADTFILGPDIIDNLKQKTKLMREHWLDVEKYLAPPHK